MTDKLLSILAIFGVIFVIGLMTWNDMHPKIETKKETSRTLASSYYADDYATPEIIPENNIPLIIAQGTFYYTKSGEVKLNRTGLSPMTFPQRQMNIEFSFKEMPEDPTETIKKIKKVLKEWKEKGNDINALFLKTLSKKPNIQNYIKLTKGLKNTFKITPYNLAPVIDLNWSEKLTKEEAKQLAKTVNIFTINLTSEDISLSLIQKLEKLKYKSFIKLPKGVFPKDLNKERIGQDNFVASYIQTLDPNHPILTQKRKIGLFPKFITR